MTSLAQAVSSALSLLLVGVSAILALELSLWAIVRLLRRNFQWLVTEADECPKLDQRALEEFLELRYDSELGWVTKPGIRNSESTGSVGAISGHEYRTTYSINGLGARSNPGHEELPCRISVYGDSFAFARQVNDDATWPWVLSELTATNVVNFGVGNYGVDQSLLRLQREYRDMPSPIVILAVVPETIVRILSVWKHYHEYGNTFAFKPRFDITDNDLRLLPNVMDSPSKFSDIREYLPLIQRHDYCYRHRFRRYVLGFPYTLSIAKHPKRNARLLTSLLVREGLRTIGIPYERPWELVLEENESFVVSLYEHEPATRLFRLLLDRFVALGRENRFQPVFLMLPFQSDLERTRANGRAYYHDFCREVDDVLPTIDMTSSLLNVNAPLYTNDFYGGHLNRLGNQVVAETVYDELSHHASTAESLKSGGRRDLIV